MKEYFVSYRNEIGLRVKAENEDEAIEKFRDELVKRGVEVLCDFWSDMFEVEEVK
jgi:mannitol/fructose-specific phosphotransferase system IIA component